MSIQQDNQSPVKTWYNPKDETLTLGVNPTETTTQWITMAVGDCMEVRE